MAQRMLNLPRETNANVVRAQGRLSKKGGKMTSRRTDEFRIPSSAALDSLALVHDYRLQSDGKVFSFSTSIQYW